MGLSALLQAAANVARLFEEPELQEQFKQLIATRGKDAARRWLDDYGAEAGLDDVTIASMKEKLK